MDVRGAPPPPLHAGKCSPAGVGEGAAVRRGTMGTVVLWCESEEAGAHRPGAAAGERMRLPGRCLRAEGVQGAGCRLRAPSCRWPRCSALPKMATVGVNKVGAGGGLEGGRGSGGSGRSPAGAAVKVRGAVRPFALSGSARQAVAARVAPSLPQLGGRGSEGSPGREVSPEAVRLGWARLGLGREAGLEAFPRLLRADQRCRGALRSGLPGGRPLPEGKGDGLGGSVTPGLPEGG